MTSGGHRAGFGHRGQRGVVSTRVLLALAASCVVTAVVSGPMAFQAYEARSDNGRPPANKVSVLPKSETRDDPSVALGPAVTQEKDTTQGPTATTTGATNGSVGTDGQIDPGTAVPRSGTTTAPRTATSTRPVTTVPRVPPTTVPPTTVVTTPTTTTPVLNGDGILFTSDRQLRNGVPLSGATVTGRIWIYVAADSVDVVRFWLDDPAGKGKPVPVELDASFSLDTTSLPDGHHTVRTETTSVGGSVTLHLAQFTVSNGG
jgi:hypothetical protein